MAATFTDAWAEGEANCVTAGEQYITVEMQHPGFVDAANQPIPLRYVLDVVARSFGIEEGAAFDAEAIVAFTPAGFECEHPTMAEGRPPVARLRVDDVSGELVIYLDNAKAFRADLKVIIRGYRSDYPAAPSYGPIELVLTDITKDSTGVEGTATIVDFGERKVPSRVYTLEDYPGLVP
ncbi:DUF1833 family protein [Ancylobacter sp.]|uniref:DUF1833 family protein n=1 Tax=Ancylobacter sp. TaxID=1872567 RepID=UPI003D1245DF